MSPTRRERAPKSGKAQTAQSTRKTAQTIVLSDPIGFVVERIVSLGPEVKVKIHDEQWVDVSFQTGSIEQVIRGLREVAEATRHGLSPDKPAKPRQRPQETTGGNSVEKLPVDSRAAASFCIAADSKLYVDAVPMPLKAYLANFVQDLCGVGAVKCTMTAGICADIRSSDAYVPNT